MLCIAPAVILAFYPSVTGAQTNALNPTGPVGIGTSAPSRPLYIKQSSVSNPGYNPLIGLGYDDSESFGGTLGLRVTSSNPRQGLKISSNLNLTFHSPVATSNPAFQWQTGAISDEASDNGTVMTISGLGGVGIGTTNPTSKLEIALHSFLNTDAFTSGVLVSGDATANPGYAGYRLALNNSTSNYAGFLRAVRTSGTTYIGLEIGSETNHGIRFLTNGTSDSAEKVRIDATGNVGVGTSNPTSKLEIGLHSFLNTNAFTSGVLVSGDATVNPGYAGYRLALNNSTSNYSGFFRAARTVGTTYIGLEIGSETNHGIRFLTNGTGDSSEKVRIDAAGNVGIGTTNPTQKLSVNGTIRAKEVVVETTGWSDYVFADNYQLESLSTVEAYIKASKHLPGIPSSKEAGEKGVSLGEMQAKLLAKIEELTLHLISLEKENQSLKARVSSLDRK